MKEFFEKFLLPQKSFPESEVRFWREKIIAVSLFGAVILGTAAFGINLFLTIESQSWEWVIIYTITYAVVLAIAFSPQVPYRIRSGTLLLILYSLGVISALQYGSAGDARIWLIGFSILTGIFLGLNAGLAAITFSTATLILLGLSMSRNWLMPPTPSDIVDPQNFSSWFSTAIPFFVIGTMSVLSLGVIINGLNKSLQMGQQLTNELEKDRERLQKRSADLERRETQVQTAAEISRAVSGEHDPERLFSKIVNLIKDRFNLYYVGLFLIDENEVYAVLSGGTGEEGKAMLAEGHKLLIGTSSMIGWAISRRQARIALDVGKEAIRFDNPYLPDTRSELAIPLISGGRVLGALTIQSDNPEAFDQEDIFVLQIIGDGLAMALENTRLFQQTEASYQEIRRLHQQYFGEAWTEVITRGEKIHHTYKNPQKKPGLGEITDTSKFERPLILREQVIGNLKLETEKAALTHEEETFIDAVAIQAALALENVRLVDATQRSAQHDRIIADISRKVWASSDIDRILRTALSELVQTFQASDGLIQLDVPKFIEEDFNSQ